MISNPGRTNIEPRTAQHRRAFLATTMMALPVLSGAIGAQARGKVDAVAKQVEREIAATIRRAQGKVRGEHLRALAASLRILHAHYFTTGAWTTADKGLARLIAQKGGVANLVLATPEKAVKADVDAAFRSYGLDEHRGHRQVDTQALTTAFEALRRNGYAKTIDAVAASLDGAAALLDDQPQQIVAVVAAGQRNDEMCWQIWWNMYVADAACAAMMLTPGAQPAAVQICMLAMFLHMYYELNGC